MTAIFCAGHGPKARNEGGDLRLAQQFVGQDRFVALAGVPPAPIPVLAPEHLQGFDAGGEGRGRDAWRQFLGDGQKLLVGALKGHELAQVYRQTEGDVEVVKLLEFRGVAIAVEHHLENAGHGFDLQIGGVRAGIAQVSVINIDRKFVGNRPQSCVFQEREVRGWIECRGLAVSPIPDRLGRFPKQRFFVRRQGLEFLITATFGLPDGGISNRPRSVFAGGLGHQQLVGVRGIDIGRNDRAHRASALPTGDRGS